jgi:hypothetical protein
MSNIIFDQGYQQQQQDLNFQEFSYTQNQQQFNPSYNTGFDAPLLERQPSEVSLSSIKAAFSTGYQETHTGDNPDEPPLLEELGIKYNNLM